MQVSTYTRFPWDSDFPFHKIHGAIGRLRRFGKETLDRCQQPLRRTSRSEIHTKGWSFRHCLRSSANRGLQMPDMLSLAKGRGRMCLVSARISKGTCERRRLQLQAALFLMSFSLPTKKDLFQKLLLSYKNTIDLHQKLFDSKFNGLDLADQLPLLICEHTDSNDRSGDPTSTS